MQTIKNFTFVLISLFAFWRLPSSGLQADALELRLRRDFGYAGGSDIQGTFTMRASGPEGLSRVTFMIDGQSIGEDTEAPYELRFNTDNYPQGAHVLSAVGQSADGRELRSNEIHTNFVSASEGFQAGMRILGPMMAIIGVALALALASSFLGTGKLRSLPAGAPRQYGAAGGAICPRCGRPFPRHFFAPNMLFGKLERCPFCGKWSIVAGQPLDALRRAERAELKDAGSSPAPVSTQEEKLRKGLDDSRYLDG